MVSSDLLTENLIQHLQYEMKHGLPRLSLSRKNIDSHFAQMKKFIQQLP